MKGRTYAVIIDEAHSSQSGKSAVKLREALTSEGFKAEAAALGVGDNGDAEEQEISSEVVFEEARGDRQRAHNEPADRCGKRGEEK